MFISLKEKYNKTAVPLMMEKFNFSNITAVPKIKKVVINVGIGKMVISSKSSDEQKKLLNSVVDNLSKIAGQKAVLIKAKKSISSFKLREGMFVGCKVILRGSKMYAFLDRLINVALPRVRDFRGIDLKSFDEKGNLTIAIREQTIFPEILPEEAKVIFGFEATIVMTADTKEQGIELARALGFPLKKQETE